MSRWKVRPIPLKSGAGRADGTRVAAEANSGQLWGTDLGDDDGLGAWQWVRVHRLYCAGVVAIVVATLLGANWAGQPGVSISSTTPASTIEAPPAYDG